MFRTMMKSKIHRARVTKADLNYEGSISVDQSLLERADILPHEQVDVYNISNGERFTTYAIAAPPNSGEIQINGAAAHKCHPGDLVIIVSYSIVSEQDLKISCSSPKVIHVDEQNQAVPEIVKREM